MSYVLYIIRARRSSLALRRGQCIAQLELGAGDVADGDVDVGTGGVGSGVCR